MARSRRDDSRRHDHHDRRRLHVEGYQSDITRTFVLGKATDKMKKVFESSTGAERRAKAARPGVRSKRSTPRRGKSSSTTLRPRLKYFSIASATDG